MSRKDILLCVVIVAGTGIAAFVSYVAQGKGYIKIDTPDVELRLRGGWFGQTAVISGDAPTALLPRTYRPARLLVTKTRGSEVWSIQGYGPWGN